MKKNKPIQKLIKPSISKLSPSNKNKSNKYANFNLTSFKNNECNKLISSPKKIKEENILSKKNLYPYSAYHRKTKSSSQNYIQFQNLMSDEIYNLNFTKTGNCKNNSNSRNKYDLFKKNSMKIRKVAIYYLLVFH